MEAAGGWGREHISSTLSRARRGPESAANFLQVKVRAGLWKRRRVPRAQPRTEVISQDGHPVLHLCHGRGPVTPRLEQPLCRDPPVPLCLHQLLQQGPLFCHQLTNNTGARCSESWARCLSPQKSHPGSAQHHLVPRGGRSWVLGAQGAKREVLLTWWVQTSSSHLRNVRHSI